VRTEPAHDSIVQRRVAARRHRSRV
jgi:hypothetical protein